LRALNRELQPLLDDFAGAPDFIRILLLTSPT